MRVVNDALNGRQIPSVTEPQRERWIFAKQNDGRNLRKKRNLLIYQICACSFGIRFCGYTAPLRMTRVPPNLEVKQSAVRQFLDAHGNCVKLDSHKITNLARSIAFPKEGKGDHVVVDEAAPYGFSVATERGTNHQVLREALL